MFSRVTIEFTSDHNKLTHLEHAEWICTDRAYGNQTKSIKTRQLEIMQFKLLRQRPNNAITTVRFMVAWTINEAE